MLEIFNLSSLIPDNLKKQVIDALVDFLADQAKKYANDKITSKIKKLRSDGAFIREFEEGLERATKRFIDEYEIKDEDLVSIIAADKNFFKNREVQKALVSILKKPGTYLINERLTLDQTFATVLPNRKQRSRVDRAVTYLLKCIAKELWHLPELQPIYSLQFQHVTAEATLEQVALQKKQLQVLTGLDVGIREALMQLTDAISEKKLLPASGTSVYSPIIQRSKIRHNLLQPDYGHFVGRENELKQIRRLLLPESRHFVVTIDGIGGIGKTALALEVAHSFLRHYHHMPEEKRFEAIIWTSAKQTILTGEGIATRPQFLRTLDDIYVTIAIVLEREDIIRARPEGQDDLVRHALTQQRTLLILDNLETVDDERVMTFIREVPDPTKVIVTTRHRLDIAYPVRLKGMKEDEGLTHIINEAKKKGVNLTKNETQQLYKRAGGVPLAVVWSLAQISYGHSVEVVLARLGQPTENIIKFCFEATLNEIRGKPAHIILMGLSLFATSASREAIGYISGFDDDVLSRDEALVTLEKLSLIDRKSDRFSMLPLTKSLANSELQSVKENRNILTERWVNFFIKHATERAETTKENLTQLAVEYQNVGQAIDWLVTAPHQPKRLLELIEAMQQFLLSRGYWNDWRAWLERAKEAAIIQNDEFLLGRSLYGLGLINILRREPDQAKQNLERAHHIFDTYQKIPELVRADIDLSRVYMFEKKYDEAEQILSSCEKFVYDLNSPELIVLLNIRKGEMFTELGALHKKSGEPYEAKKSLDQAEKSLTEALNIKGEREATYGLNFIYWRLGVTFIEKEDYQDAHEYLSRSLDVAKDLQMANGIAHATGWLAILNEKVSKFEEAKNLAIAAKDRFLSLGMKSHAQELEQLITRINHHHSQAQ